MISDLVIGMIHALYAGLVALMPAMPERPGWLDNVAHLWAWSAVLLPFDEIQAFMPVLLATLGALALWRVIRLLLPGG